MRSSLIRRVIRSPSAEEEFPLSSIEVWALIEAVRKNEIQPGPVRTRLGLTDGEFAHAQSIVKSINADDYNGVDVLRWLILGEVGAMDEERVATLMDLADDGLTIPAPGP